MKWSSSERVLINVSRTQTLSFQVGSPKACNRDTPLMSVFLATSCPSPSSVSPPTLPLRPYPAQPRPCCITHQLATNSSNPDLDPRGTTDTNPPSRTTPESAIVRTAPQLCHCLLLWRSLPPPLNPTPR
jgi:hypothetical protein